jgi:hypothetical protein
MRSPVLILLVLAWSGLAGANAGTGEAPPAAGLIQFEPPQAVSCVAVRVTVPQDQMITGMRWYNGSASESFPRILVASGSGILPPPCAEAVAVAEGVQGVEQGWSEVTFATPVASESGTLFVVLEYPPGYAPPVGQAALGVGYAEAESPLWYFVTGDGETWIKVVSRCRVLLEPVLADRAPGVAVKSARPREETPVPPASATLVAYPNPFNPSTRIELNLPKATTGSVRIVDLRGYAVAELHRGALVKGTNAFVWNGRSSSGSATASGVYWVLAEADELRLTRKLLLIK